MPHCALKGRVKDFYDLWSLATCCAFDGPLLAPAPGETFRRRRTALPTSRLALAGQPGAPPVSAVTHYALCPLATNPPHSV